jgi:hypothetical protein
MISRRQAPNMGYVGGFRYCGVYNSKARDEHVGRKNCKESYHFLGNINYFA